MDRYAARYRDHDGELEGVLSVGAGTFALEVGGVRFEGATPASLEPVSHEPWAQSARFWMDLRGALGGCALEWSQPMQVLRVEDGHIAQHALLTRLWLGTAPATRAGQGSVVLWLGLEHEGQLWEGRASYYERALSAIAQALPAGHHLRCCWGCDLSDYHPVGQGMIGSMMCFVEHAAAYRAIDDADWPKDALFDLIALAEPLTLVAETHVCDRFEPRRPGAGYRG
jgi:hypothetical protein